MEHSLHTHCSQPLSQYWFSYGRCRTASGPDGDPSSGPCWWLFSKAVIVKPSCKNMCVFHFYSPHSPLPVPQTAPLMNNSMVKWHAILWTYFCIFPQKNTKTDSKMLVELDISIPKVTDRSVFRRNKSCLNTTSGMFPTSAPVLHNTKQTNAAGNSSSYWCCKKSFHIQQSNERLHAPANQKKKNKSSSSL